MVGKFLGSHIFLLVHLNLGLRLALEDIALNLFNLYLGPKSKSGATHGTACLFTALFIGNPLFNWVSKVNMDDCRQR